MTFENIFQSIVLCQSSGKGTEETEVFALIYFRIKLMWRMPQNSSERKCDEDFFLVKWHPATLLKKDSITVIFLYHRGNKSMLKIYS